MAKTKTQKKNYQSWREGRRKLEDDNLFSKYSNRFKRKKQVDGKWVDWDIRTDAPWNPEAAWNTIYQNVYGTETPGIDNKYLNAKEAFDNEQGRIKGGDALSDLRRQFSPKTVNEGERQIDIKREKDRLKKESELLALKQDSSFRIDHESIPNWEGGEFEETDEVGVNQNWVQTPSPTWGMNDTDRVNKANIQIAINAANQNKKVSEIGGKEYVTDYQTAVRNAGGPWGDVEQYYGEDVLDSAGNRVRKSNVFTRRMNEDGTYGDPMGVLTRRQRLAEDLKLQEAQNKTKPNLVQTPSPTWTVDQNKKQQPESTKVNPQKGSVPSGTSFKPIALSPEYADSIFFDPENFAK